MTAVKQSAKTLDSLLDAHAEWLVIGESGRTFPVNRNEIEIFDAAGKTLFGTIGENGFHSRRLESFSCDDDHEINVSVADPFGGQTGLLRLVPRVSAAELAANIDLARLEKANEIASLVEDSEAGIKIVRVGLNKGSGRFAEIICEAGRKRFAVFADVAGGATAELILTASILWFERLQMRAKKPARELHIVAEKRSAGNLQKLHALLKTPVRSKIRIFEINRSAGLGSIRPRAELAVSRLWREKPKKIDLPQTVEPSETARDIIAMSPGEIDIMHSRHGETLRFHGFPFARVRTMAGGESAWFGIDRLKRPLNAATRPDFERLVADLQNYRTADTASKRHEFYRVSPESWLESILRRNIKLLDANLILAPIYNQFRTVADRIDLLALRCDGRLVIIEIKASPDREMPFQAADYWRKIEHARRRDELRRAKVFGDLEIIDQPALVYAVAPALSFHRDFEFFARMLSPEIEMWRFELHENWREEIKVITRRNYFE